ncbi:hypothetical protein EDB86DRAFT_2872358 [Lactarius hatsudake]|nr:hypothetical protein EDB86DRAFT_2872358 [Lactarius hatsudake]
MAKREAKAKAEAGAEEKEAGATANVPNEAKSETAVATTDKHVNTNTTDARNASEAATTVPNSPGDKSADFAAASSETESKQAQMTTPEEVVASSEPNKDSVPASTVPPAPTKATPAPSVPENGPAPERDAPVAKERTPTSEPAASAPSKPNGEPEAPNAPDADAKKASETPAQTESPLAEQGSGEKPYGAATELAPQLSQTGEAVGEKPAAKGDDAKPEGPVKPVLCPDHFHEASAAATMSASGPRTSVDEASLSSLEKEDDGEASKAWAKLPKNKRKRLRDKARKQAQMGAMSGTTSKSVDISVVQEHKPVTSTASVGTLVWGRDGPVDVKMESGDDDAPVIVEKHDAVATPVEMAVDDSDGWDW